MRSLNVTYRIDFLYRHLKSDDTKIQQNRFWAPLVILICQCTRNLDGISQFWRSFRLNPEACNFLKKSPYSGFCSFFLEMVLSAISHHNESFYVFPHLFFRTKTTSIFPSVLKHFVQSYLNHIGLNICSIHW